LFGEDEEGYGIVLSDGVVPSGRGHEAHLAVANCPEHAIEVIEEA
jgi:ferredoxin